MRVLFHDIEILPLHFHTNFGADRSTLCTFGYKFQGDKKAKYLDLLDYPTRYASDPFDEKMLVKDTYKIMKEADVIIHHYGDKFDFPYLNTKFLKYGLPPIDMVDLRDTWKASKYKLKLSSNRLNTVAEYFGLPMKDDIPVSHWYHAIAGKKKCMKELSQYCAQDVEVLEAVYNKLQPLMPHRFRMLTDKLSCPMCGHHQYRKHSIFTTKGGYEKQVLMCKGCAKHWSLGKKEYEKLTNG